MDAIQIEQLGGPEVLHAAEFPTQPQGPARCWSGWPQPGSTTLTRTTAPGSTPTNCHLSPARRGAG